MILDTALKTIEVILPGAITTNQLEITADWVDTANGSTFAPGGTSLVTNGGTAVTAVSSPAANVQRQVKSLVVYNADTVSQIVTVRLFDGSNRRRFMVATLAPGQSLVFTPEGGWTLPTASFITGYFVPTDATGHGITFSSVATSFTKFGNLCFLTLSAVVSVNAQGTIAEIGGVPASILSGTADFSGNGVIGAASSPVVPLLRPTGGGFIYFFNPSSAGTYTWANLSGDTISVQFAYSI